ncbi:hypothetical protein FSP39_000252 [Pinctada imbricata]|uniref:G-protein coupled receptors family 1 profile domain-containing protein n=1 Tax=Pinctada imbricata TaxID=66713 RepID=A0AA88XNZ0_PINIB|nr:hypothetical protein FSP39_000252 [Pinctada imbricata]
MLFIINTTPQLKNSTNTYLCNLAIADLSVSLICVPMAVGQALYRVWIYGIFMCKITSFLQGVTVAASIYTISVLSLDRFLAIRHPMVFRRISGTGIAIRIIIVIWICSMALMSPLLFVRKIESFPLLLDQSVNFCVEKWQFETQRQTYDLCLFALVYIVPGVIICSAYGMIGKELWKQDENLQRKESETSKGIGKHVMNSRKRVARMLVALAIVFAVCWLPFYVVTLYIDFNFHKKNLNPFVQALPFAILLGHANSALNPILYFYSSKSFRKYLFRALKCRRNVAKRNFAIRHPQPPEKEENGNPRIPLLKLGSTTTKTRSRSTGGSFKFSRSSNTSLRSTNLSFKSKDIRSNNDRASFKTRNGILKERAVVQVDICENVDNEIAKPLMNTNHHRRDIMERTLSIPTTINEESSRVGSVSPMKPIHCFNIGQIPELQETDDDQGDKSDSSKTTSSNHHDFSSGKKFMNDAPL